MNNFGLLQIFTDLAPNYAYLLYHSRTTVGVSAWGAYWYLPKEAEAENEALWNALSTSDEVWRITEVEILLGILTEREFEAINSYYCLDGVTRGSTLTAKSKEMGCTLSRMRKLHQTALRRMAERLFSREMMRKRKGENPTPTPETFLGTIRFSHKTGNLLMYRAKFTNLGEVIASHQTLGQIQGFTRTHQREVDDFLMINDLMPQ